MNVQPLYESKAMRRITGPTVRPGSLDLTDRALSVCRLNTGALVIDAGCGLGATVDHLRQRHGFKAFGVDQSLNMLETGRLTFPEASIFSGRAERLPLPDRSVDAVICECVLSLADDPAQTLDEFHRVMKPGGYLILSDLYLRAPENQIPLSGEHTVCCLQGAVGREIVLRRLAYVPFKLILWEDHSERLKQLAAQIVWEYGSLNQFQELFGPCGPVSGPSGKPGYFLLTAQKEA